MKSKFFLRAAVIGLLTMVTASDVMAQTLTVTVGKGKFAVGNQNSFTFPANAAAVSGGSGSYSYLWTETDDGNAAWSNGAAGASYAPTASGVISGCNGSLASYIVIVTDTVTGQTATSNKANYGAFNDKSAHGPPVFPDAPPAPIGCQ
jgi:hypothetical protein